MRLVIDTNVVLSRRANPTVSSGQTFLIAITKPARLYVSASVLEEYATSGGNLQISHPDPRSIGEIG